MREFREWARRWRRSSEQKSVDRRKFNHAAVYQEFRIDLDFDTKRWRKFIGDERRLCGELSDRNQLRYRLRERWLSV